MKLTSTSRRKPSTLLICATVSALAFAAGPQSVRAQADAPQAGTAGGWIAEAVRQAGPAVVRVEAAPSPGQGLGIQMPDEPMLEEFLRRFGDEERRGLSLPRLGGETDTRTGSGFVVSADGLIVTAAELVAASDAVEVTLEDGTTYPASVVGSDAESGIAVLRIEASTSLPALEWGEADGVALGTELVALGRSEAFGATAWTGRLAAADADGRRFLIDDPLGPSATGAPLLGPAGTVVGIAGIGVDLAAANASLALTATAARDIVDELTREGMVTRGYLGVQIQPVTPDLASALGLDTAEGAIVTGVRSGAPAESAGVREGDVILSINGEPVSDPAELSRRVSELEPGETVQLEVWRGNQTTQLEATLAGLPGSEAQAARAPAEDGTALPEIGLMVSELTPELRDRLDLPEAATGVVVSDVDAEVAASSDIREGDVIVSVQRQQVSSVADLQAALRQVQAQARNAVLLLVQREDVRSFVAVPLKQG